MAVVDGQAPILLDNNSGSMLSCLGCSEASAPVRYFTLSYPCESFCHLLSPICSIEDTGFKESLHSKQTENQEDTCMLQ